MKGPAISAKGMLELGIFLVVLYILYEVEHAASNAIDALANDIGGGAYDLINGDANALVQGTFASEEAELKANGYPPVGSAKYNQIVIKYNPSQVVGTAGVGSGS